MMLQQNSKLNPASKSSFGVVNVRIEAPMIVLPDTQGLWVADMGVFVVRRDGDTSLNNPQDFLVDATLECSETRLYYCHELKPVVAKQLGSENTTVVADSDYSQLGEFTNLNCLADHPRYLLDLVETQMHQIIQAVNFRICIGSKRAPGLATDDVLAPHTLVEFEPFRIDLIEGSLDSFFSTLFSLFKDSAREKDRASKLALRAEYSTPGLPEEDKKTVNSDGPIQRDSCRVKNTMIHFNVGYEYWEPGVLYLDKSGAHMVSINQKILGSWIYGSIAEVSIQTTRKTKHAQGSETPHYYLVFKYGAKLVEFRCRNMQVLNGLKFKLEQIKQLEEQQEAKVNKNPFPQGESEVSLTQLFAATSTISPPSVPSSNFYSLSLVLKGLSLSVSGYHSRGVDFEAELTNLRYNLRSSEAQELGELLVQRVAFRDTNEGREILMFRGLEESDSQAQQDGLDFSYEYGLGRLTSRARVARVESAYKADYIRSLLLLSEVVLDLILQNTESAEIKAYKASKGEGGVRGERKIPGLPEFIDAGEESYVLKPSSSLESTFDLEIGSAKVELFYKKEIRCVEVVTGKIWLVLEFKDEEMTVKGDIVGAGIYDLHSYPYRSDSPCDKREALLCFTNDGKIGIDVLMDSKELKANYTIKGIRVFWIQQRAMRLIDFIMFQVVEIFYPSLLSMSTHYSPEEVIRFALAILNDNNYAKQQISLEDIQLTLPSTTDSGTFLRISSSDGKASNSRYLLSKTCNQNALKYYPIAEPETEIWSISLRNVQLEVSSRSSVRRPVDLLHDEDLSGTQYSVQPASEPFELSLEVQMLKKTFELQFLYEVVEDPLKFPKNVTTNPPKAGKRQLKPECSSKQFLTQVAAFSQRLESKLPKEILCLDGRYVLDVKADRVQVLLTNQFVNVLMVIMENNINFDDKMEETLRNAYQISLDGVPVLTRVSFCSLVASLPDLHSPSLSLLSLSLANPRLTCDKQSDFETKVDLSAREVSGDFGEALGLGSRTAFVRQREYCEILEGSSEEDEEGMGQGVRQQGNGGLVYLSGKMYFRKDGRKEVELKLTRAQLRLFSFLSRLVPELLMLDEVPLPAGFEAAPPGQFSLLAKIPRAEICLPSGQESCLVIAAELNYHMHSDAKTSQQIISICGAEIFDCLEDIYISKGIDAVKKRNIARPFDFNFIMREDILNNRLEYTVSSGNILAKLTAFNIQVLQSIYTYQTLAEELVKNRSVYYVPTEERQKLLASQARRQQSPDEEEDDLLQARKQRVTTTLSMDGFSFVYVDNYKDIFLPVLRFDVKIKDFRYSIKSQQEMEALLEFNALHNNSNIAKWEPLIEPVAIRFVYQRRPDMTIFDAAIGLDDTNLEGLNFNLTEELLETALHCLSNIRKVTQDKQLRGTGDLDLRGGTQTTPNKGLSSGGFLLDTSPAGDFDTSEEIYDSQFLVKNHTGHEIWVQTVGDKKGKKVGLKNNQERFVSFLLDDEFSTKESLNRDLILTFSPELGLKAPIVFSVEKLGQVYHEVKQMPIIITIMKENLKRVAIISSRLRLINQTDLNLQYAVMGEHSVYDQGTMAPNSTGVPIAFDRIYENLTLGVKTSLSQKISLAKISRMQKKNLCKTPLICARESFNNLCIDVIPRGFCHDLEVKPILRIYNYCPAPIEYILKARGFSESNMIFRGKSLQVFQFDPYEQECLLTLTCGDIFSETMDLRGFISKKQGFTETLKLRSKQVPDSKVYLELTNLPQKNAITIHSRLNVFNETGLHLDLKSFNSGALSSPPRDLIQAGDRNIMFMPGRKHDTFLVYPTAKTMEAFPGAGPVLRSSYSAFPKKMNCTLNQTVRGGKDQGYFELNFLVIPKIIKLPEGILTKTLTISPKYIFINKTTYSMTVIQQLSREN